MGKITEGILLGMGNPLLDISAEVGPEYLEKYGLEPRNAILAEDKHLPIYPDLVKNHKVQYIGGGATQNSIRMAQWALGLPHATTYIGCIGNDAYGTTLKKCVAEDNVRAEYLEDPDTPTGTCAVLVTGTDRSLVANLAAANKYQESHIQDAANWPLVEKAQYYYIGGFFLTVSVPSILAVARHAAENNKLFSMNLSAPFICEFFKSQLDEVSPYWDIIFGNQTEARAFSKAQGFDTEDVAEIALKTAGLPKENKKRSRMVVYTQSAEPTVVVVDGKVTKYPVPAVPAEEIVDTNAAGDSFVGGFMSQWVQGKSVEECVKAGNYSAGLIIRTSGCQVPSAPFAVPE